MIIKAIFSKPTKTCDKTLGKPYIKVKVQLLSENEKNESFYFAEFFTSTQVFHKKMTESELNDFIKKNAGKTFKNCIITTDKEEKTILANKKGKITELIKANNEAGKCTSRLRSKCISTQKTKNYILSENVAVPFLVLLGVQTKTGKIVAQKYDKFRQINRFLEFICDILPEVMKQINGLDASSGRPLKIVDFGSGKSYLTFAVQYFLEKIKKIDAEIVGLDLKSDVVDFCNKTAKELDLKNLHFEQGDIKNYATADEIDIIITLHACDTATDYALFYAVKKNCKAILSVPCCQHEINLQLDKNLTEWKKTDAVPKDFEPILKYGILKERFSAIVTDALRAEYLEANGYNVQLLEFIDDTHTPKNILIRATKNAKKTNVAPNDKIAKTLQISQKLGELLKK